MLSPPHPPGRVQLTTKARQHCSCRTLVPIGSSGVHPNASQVVDLPARVPQFGRHPQPAITAKLHGDPLNLVALIHVRAPAMTSIDVVLKQMFPARPARGILTPLRAGLLRTYRASRRARLPDNWWLEQEQTLHSQRTFCGGCSVSGRQRRDIESGHSTEGPNAVLMGLEC
jgi:hypothetical protein